MEKTNFHPVKKQHQQRLHKVDDAPLTGFSPVSAPRIFWRSRKRSGSRCNFFFLTFFWGFQFVSFLFVSQENYVKMVKFANLNLVCGCLHDLAHTHFIFDQVLLEILSFFACLWKICISQNCDFLSCVYY